MSSSRMYAKSAGMALRTFERECLPAACLHTATSFKMVCAYHAFSSATPGSTAAIFSVG